jgi:bromodomain adjacent to zinc finger domain protein 1A
VSSGSPLGVSVTARLITPISHRYFARIAKAFPPASIRALAPDDDDKPSSSSAAGPSSPAPAAVDDYSKVCHKIGTDMNVEAETAKKDDDPEEYLYTVQLMDEEHKFEGSFMEVKAKALR